MLVHRRVTPVSMSLVPIYTPGWREIINVGKSFLSKKTTWWQGLGLNSCPSELKSNEHANHYTTTPIPRSQVQQQDRTWSNKFFLGEACFFWKLLWTFSKNTTSTAGSQYTIDWQNESNLKPSKYPGTPIIFVKGTGSWLGACAWIKLIFSDLLVILSVNYPTHMYLHTIVSPSRTAED